MPTDYRRDIFEEESDEVKRKHSEKAKKPKDSKSDTSATDQNEQDVALSLLYQRKKSGKKIIAIIGFSESGKTFYINRLRKDLPTYDKWFCTPTAKEKIVLTTLGMFETLVTKAVKGRERGYVIMDVAGESFRRGFIGQNDMLESTQRLAVDPVYLAIIALADAYMLFIPSKDLDRLGEKNYSDQNGLQKLNKAMIESFHNIIGLIKIAHRRITLRGEEPEQFIKRGVTGSELERVFGWHEHTTRKPLCILYSQADIYEKISLDPDFDIDPFLFTFKNFPSLAYPINQFFDYYRFDFLSAFHGQQDPKLPNYDLKSHGALEAFYWIHELLDAQTPFYGTAKRLWKGYLPTRKAIKLRRWFDRDFRREWKSFGI